MNTTLDIVKQFFPDKSKSTLTAYSKDLDFFAGFLKKNTAQETLNLLLGLPENQANLVVLHYKSELLESEQSISSINRKLSTLRSLVKAAKTAGLVNWTLGVPNEKAEKQSYFKCLTKTQINAVLSAAKNQPNQKKAARDYALMRLLFDLALKRQILADLQLSDYNLENKTLHIRFGKEQTIKTKLLPIKTANALNKWLEHRNQKEGPFFQNLDSAAKKNHGLSATSIYRIVKQIGEGIDLHVTPEEIRKAAIKEVITHAARLGVSDQELLVFSDHKHSVSLKKFKDHQSKIQESLSNLVARN
jgi:integrase/recombinase XerC